jgi:hypothetical protein
LVIKDQRLSALLPNPIVRQLQLTATRAKQPTMNAPVKEQKVIDAIAIGTCVSAIVLLLSFADATIAANSWRPPASTQTEKDISVALSTNKDSDALRAQAPLSDK